MQFQPGATRTALEGRPVSSHGTEAGWMISNNIIQEKKVPDCLNYIYVDGLKAVKPEAVNIIR